MHLSLAVRLLLAGSAALLAFAIEERTGHT